MGLSEDLVSQFVKVTNDVGSKSKETTVYGTTRIIDGKVYVKIDGAENDQLTPVETTVDVKEDERVSILIKNHTATITGNTSSPAARTGDVQELSGKLGDVIAGSVTTEQLTATNAEIEKLKAKDAEIENLVAEKADIEHLHAEFAEIDTLKAKDAEIENLVAKKADIDHLHAEYAEIKTLEAEYAKIERLDADMANIDTLYAKKADIESLNTKYANIDFANVGEADMEKIYAKFGFLEDVTVKDGVFTGELVAVTISGDLIETNTLKAEKLIVKGEDGLYYQLNVNAGATPTATQLTEEQLQNGLHGTAIIAKTVTADKISVSDLKAFGATIGGFVIDDDSIHSSVKTTIDNTTRGFYVDNDGQLNLGDAFNYIKYFKDTDNKYKLKIAAESLTFGVSGNTIEDVVQDAVDNASGVGELKDRVDDLETDVDTAQNTANNANTAASNAQSTANAANTAASNAQSTANAANTAASNAQNTANTARDEASDAAKTATNYVHADANGLVVGDHTGSTLKGNVLIDTDSVDVRNGTTVLSTFGSNSARIGKSTSQNVYIDSDSVDIMKNGTVQASFGANKIELGKNSKDSIIDFCAGNTTLKATKNNSGYYDGCRFDTTGSFRAYGDTGAYLGAGLDDEYDEYSGLALSRSTQTSTFTLDAKTYNDDDNDEVDNHNVNAHISGDVTPSTAEIRLTAEAYTSSSSWNIQELRITKDETWLTGTRGTYGSGSGSIRPWNVELWSGASVMYSGSGYNITLEHSVSSQPAGIVLVFGDIYDLYETWKNTLFIPKKLVAEYGTLPVSATWVNESGNIGFKRLYISNTQITGYGSTTEENYYQGRLYRVYGV